MPTLLRTALTSLVILAAGTAVLAGATDGFQAFTTESLRRSGIRKHPPVVPPLPLQTAAGGLTSFGELRGRWLLVDFIYTRCLTYCSVLGHEFARLQRQLAGPIAAGEVALVSISFDLERDDPAALTLYQHRHGNHGPGWIAARPLDQAELAALLRTFGVVVVPAGQGEFVHNAAIAVVDPAGRVVTIVDWDDPEGAVRTISQRQAP